MGSFENGTMRPGGRTPEDPSRERLRLLISVAVAGTLGLVWWSTSPSRLSGHIDIVGYPTFSDFAFQRSFLAYRLVIWEFPIVSALVYALLRSRGPLRGPLRISTLRSPGRIEMVDAGDDQQSGQSIHTPGQRALRLMPAAILVAVAVSPSTDAAGARIAPVDLLAGAASVAAVLTLWALVTPLLRRRGGASRFAKAGERLSVVNAFAVATVSLGALVYVSAHTMVITAAHGRRYWPWFPAWLAAVVLLAVLTWMVWRLASGWEPHRVERRVMAVLLGSVSVFLLTAAIPGGIPWFSGFDDAQSVVGADLLTRGYFPWRDFMFIHGLFDDALRSSIGFGVFEHSIWGAAAGTALIVVPMCWVGYYLLSIWAGRSRSLIVLGIFALAAWGAFPASPRFVAVPFVFILLGEALRRTRPHWTILFTVAMFVEAVLVPETSFQVIAAAITIVAADVVHRNPERPWWSALRRTRYFVATGAALSGLLAAFLALNHALVPFLQYYAIFGPGHNAAGATPPSGIATTAAALFFTSMTLVMLTIWMVASRLLNRRSWTTQDWVTVSAAILTGLYGEKAVGRFDGQHVAQTLAVALPLWIMWAAHGLRSAEDLLRAHRSHRREPRPGRMVQPKPATILGLVLTIVLVPNVAWAVWHVPGNTTAVVRSTGSTPLAGYQEPGAIDRLLLDDLKTVLNTYAGRNGELFDNTNSLGYFFHLLQRAPVSTFVHVSMAQPKFVQQMLIDQLARSRPALVSFDDDTIGLPAWDGPRNNVRHFKVAQYLLDGWTPILRTHSFLFMLRNDLVAKMPSRPTLTSLPQTSSLGFSNATCDWGFTANFLGSQPAGREVSLPVKSLTDMSRLSVRGWSYDLRAHAAPSRIVITLGSSVVADVPLSISRPEVAATLEDPAANMSGFDASVLMSGHGTPGVYALGADGALHPIGSTPGPPTGYVQMPDGTRLSVTTRTDGSVELAAWSISRLLSISIPASVDLSSFKLATFTAGRTIGTARLDLTDERIQIPVSADAAGRQLLKAGHEINANVLPLAGSAIAVRVGSCLQWHSYKSRTLYLLQTGGVPITALRLSGVGN